MTIRFGPKAGVGYKPHVRTWALHVGFWFVSWSWIDTGKLTGGSTTYAMPLRKLLARRRALEAARYYAADLELVDPEAFAACVANEETKRDA